jgi:hypothetical protein
MNIPDDEEAAGSVTQIGKKPKKRVANCFGQFMKSEALRVKKLNPVGKVNFKRIRDERKDKQKH